MWEKATTQDYYFRPLGSWDCMRRQGARAEDGQHLEGKARRSYIRVHMYTTVVHIRST